MNKYNIYAIGAALVDTEIQVDDSDLNAMDIEKGVMTLVDEERQQMLLSHLKDKLVASPLACGGSAANSVIAAQYFGASTFFSCQVANDEHGKFYADDLMRAGVATQAHKDARTGVTGKCLVMITPDAERTMNTHLGISESFSQSNLDLPALEQSSYLYIEGYLVTSPTGKPAAIAAYKHAKAAGVKVAISLSDPGIVNHFRTGLLDIVDEGVDLIFCNEAEAIAFSETDNLEAAAEILKKFSTTFVITRGSESTWAFDGEQLHQIDAMPTQAIDTNGAGDMFAGAFLAAHNQGKPFPDAAAFANRAAAKVVSQYGPRLKPEQYAELKKAL